MVFSYPERFLDVYGLHRLWEEGTFCDIRIRITVGYQSFHAHHIALSAGCDCYKTMFECGLMENKAHPLSLQPGDYVYILTEPTGKGSRF